MAGRELYNLQTDLSETNNVAGANTEVVERLTALMRRYIDEGRQRRGSASEKTTLTFPVDGSAAGHKKKGKKAGKKARKEVALALAPLVRLRDRPACCRSPIWNMV